MVNMQPGDQGNDFWYPQLPEGYEGNYSQSMPAYEAGGWQNGMNMGHYEMQRSPGGGFPGQGMPGFRPGGGFPGQGMPGFPPGGGFPGQGAPGFPPGGGFPGQGHQDSRQVVAFQDRGHQGFRQVGGFPGGPQGQQRPTSPPPQRTPEYPSHTAICSRPRCNSRLSIPIHICLAFKKTRFLVLSCICRTQFCRGLEMAR